MKVLVTGASGFVGTRLVQRFLEEFTTVRGTYRRRLPVVPGVDWRLVSQLDCAEIWPVLLRDVEVVVHLAALAHQMGWNRRREEILRVNVDGTRAIARACRTAAVRRLIFASSIAAVCTTSEVPVDDQTPAAPQEDYGRSKLEAENALKAELIGGATDWCILRPPLVYGPGNPGNMRRLMKLVDSGLPLPFGSIHNRRSFIFVDNLVDAIVTVARHPNDIRATYVLGDGSDYGTPELVAELAAVRERSGRVVRMPLMVLRLAGRLGDLMGRVFRMPISVDSYSVNRLLSSLAVDGTRFCESFKWRPPVDRTRALWLTCNRLPERVDNT